MLTVKAVSVEARILEAQMTRATISPKRTLSSRRREGARECLKENGDLECKPVSARMHIYIDPSLEGNLKRKTRRNSVKGVKKAAPDSPGFNLSVGGSSG